MNKRRQTIQIRKAINHKLLLSLLSLFFLQSCGDASNPFNAVGVGLDDSGGSRSSNGSLSQNSWQSIDEPYYGRVLEFSPAILEDNPSNLDPKMNIARYLTGPLFITDSPILQESCAGDSSGSGVIDSCYNVIADTGARPIGPYYDRWAFEVDTSEFDQVQTFYHMKKVINYYLDSLKYLYYNQAQPGVDPGLNYNTSIPLDLYNKKAHFFDGETMTSYARCDFPNNAFFETATNTICLGYLGEHPQVKVAHDPSVIQHELGHALTNVILNMRTIAQTTNFPFRSEIKYSFYDEAGSINEGVADFFAHMFDQRDAVFEYMFGSFTTGFRPVTEGHPLHAEGISNEPEDRLAYPHFVNYIPETPADQIEDVHQAGMIISHFLTALKRDLVEKCSWSHEQAVQSIFNVLIETYAYLGDLSSTGNDFYPKGTVNHSNDLDSAGVPTSLLWYSRVRPTNFRSWAQTFGRFFVQTISKTSSKSCNGSFYPQDYLETLMDSYGILLFDNYNDDGNHHTKGHNGSNHKINPENRLKTALIDKDLLVLDPREDATQVFVFDKRRDIQNAVETLLDTGLTDEISTKINSELIHNNGNGQVSPGEVVGLAFNLYNSSNSEMGGVQVLSNDWDHVKVESGKRKPCPNFADEWPNSSEGAASVDDEDSASPQSGECQFTTRTNGNKLASTGGTDEPAAETNEYVHPVCFVQITDESATYWASQEQYREQVGLEKKDCLDESNSHSCFMRAIKGGDSAYYSRIEPNKSWAETIVDINTNQPTYGPHNLLFFEINRETPPGTTFECRFRVRFTNCKNCWNDESKYDGDDFLDYEFSGEKPFKILHYQFTIFN